MNGVSGAKDLHLSSRRVRTQFQSCQEEAEDWRVLTPEGLRCRHSGARSELRPEMYHDITVLTDMENEEQLPKTKDPPVIRTDFEDEEAWKAIRELISQPVREAGQDLFAYMEFLDDAMFRDLSEQELLARVPSDYWHTFLFVVDKTAIHPPEYPVLVIDLHHERGRTFRAIPSLIQCIENNLSISNMDFYSFADSADEDGVLRGFRD